MPAADDDVDVATALSLLTFFSRRRRLIVLLFRDIFATDSMAFTTSKRLPSETYTTHARAPRAMETEGEEDGDRGDAICFSRVSLMSALSYED